jgi:hypothetical protein
LEALEFIGHPRDGRKICCYDGQNRPFAWYD